MSLPKELTQSNHRTRLLKSTHSYFECREISEMSNVLERVDNIIPVIKENRELTEQSRQLAPAVVDALRASGLCRLGLEKILHGTDEDPVDSLKVFEELAKAEGSVAWVVWNNHFAGTFGRFLNDELRADIYGNALEIYANSAIPQGVAKATEGGYEVSGTWPLVSGCHSSDWMALRAIVQDGEEVPTLGPGTELRIYFLRSSEVQILDTWDVGGLRGTGSHHVRADGVFVPANRSISFDDDIQQTSDYSKIPIMCMNAAGCASIALGLARVCIDTLIALGKERVTPGPRPDLRDHEAVQMVVAMTDVGLSAARMNLHNATTQLWHEVRDSSEPSDLTIAGVWAAAHHAATTARTVASDIYAAAGTAAMHTSSPIERAHRDIYAVLQHGIIQPHWMKQVAQVKMDPDSVTPAFRT
ncbi:MAG: acyl-CoA dehydrogenase family protein [Granulosicoccus sp.]